jgi:cell division septation protein DedD
MKSGEQILILTSKGAEELRNHASQLDVSAKNTLALIAEGCNTADAILQRSMFPHNAVVDGLRRLLTKKLVIMADDEAAARAGGAAGSARSTRRELRLNFGISPSQARFALSNFCMDEFGTDGQYLVDAVSLCNDVMSLQELLNSVRSEIDERFPGRLPALVACVHEINETDDTSPTGAHAQPAAPAAKPAPIKPAPAKPAAAKPAPASPAPAKPAAPKAASDRAPDIRPAPTIRKPTSAAGGGPDPMRLESGISLAQARFALSEFCLNQFGVQGREFVDAVNRCSDVNGAQKVLNLIRTELLNRHREGVPLLLACVREINETAL